VIGLIGRKINTFSVRPLFSFSIRRALFRRLDKPRVWRQFDKIKAFEIGKAKCESNCDERERERTSESISKRDEANSPLKSSRAANSKAQTKATESILKKGLLPFSTVRLIFSRDLRVGPGSSVCCV
jgi:hypothetical protein